MEMLISWLCFQYNDIEKYKFYYCLIKSVFLNSICDASQFHYPCTAIFS